MSPAFATLAVGSEARWSHVVTASDIDDFARLSGDDNPLHLDDDYARRQGFSGRVAHGMLLSAWVSRMLGVQLPGPGVLWAAYDARFRRPAYVGDEIEVVARVTHVSAGLRSVVAAITISNQHGEDLMTGEAKTVMLEQPAAVPWSESVTVVTGAGRGIGAAIALAIGQQGGRVVVNYRSDQTAAEAVVAAVAEAGGQAIAVAADVATPEGGQALADAALEAFGRVDNVVNNATPAIDRKPIEELGWDEVDTYWRTYVQGPFALMQRVLPGMKERGHGRFVHMLTTAIWGTPPSGTAGYVTAKSALWGLTKSMALELAPHGITANAVSPSAVLTDQWSGESDARRRALAMSVPARRLASPREVAATVVFLLGEQGAYLTGTNVPVAGGEVM